MNEVKRVQMDSNCMYSLFSDQLLRNTHYFSTYAPRLARAHVNEKTTVPSVFDETCLVCTYTSPFLLLLFN